jgi:hypothetical protein
MLTLSVSTGQTHPPWSLDLNACNSSLSSVVKDKMYIAAIDNINKLKIRIPAVI